MATRRYSINPGDPPTPILENVGAATVNKTIELTVDFALVTGKHEVVLALTKLSDWVTQQPWPPA